MNDTRLKDKDCATFSKSITYPKNLNNSYRILVFTATYNELDNIRSLLNEVWKVIPDADILVVDDNSPDGTGTLLDQIAVAEKQLKAIHRYKKLGLGTAHHLAMVYAIKQNYDVLVTMDADHSHDPAEMPRLLEKLVQADFVIGSRYMLGGSCDYGGYRKFLSVSANTAARLLLGIPLHEFTTSYRALRVSALAKVNFVKMHNRGYSYFMESVYRFHQAGLTITEVPIYFHNRNAGSSKIPKLEIIRGILKLFHLFLSRIIRRKIQTASPMVEDVCVNCHSGFLSTRFPSKATVSRESNVFSCSTMVHSSKPHVAKCLQCGLNQVPQSEHPKGLESLYADVVDQDYINNLPAKRKTFARAYQRIEPFLTSKGNLIEIGSYCGLFLNEAKRRGWNVIGVEPSRWAANYAISDSGCKVLNCSFEMAAPSLKEKFDVAVSWDVLEHVRDPAEWLKIINGLLNPGGIVAFSTLDIDNWFPRFLGRKWPWIIEMHLFYFDSEVFQQMLREAGFEVVRVEPYRHYASLRYIYKKICNNLPEPAKNVLFIGNRLIPEWVIPVSFGDIKLYIGKKKPPD